MIMIALGDQADMPLHGEGLVVLPLLGAMLGCAAASGFLRGSS